MTEKTFTFMETGNCWNIENTEIFLHVPFLKNSSAKYLKRLFLKDFNLILSDENIDILRNITSTSLTISGNDF